MEYPVLLLLTLLALVVYSLLRNILCKLAGESSPNQREKKYRSMPAEQRSTGSLPGILLLLLATSLPINAMILLRATPAAWVPGGTLLCTIAAELSFLHLCKVHKLRPGEMYQRIGAYLYHSGNGHLPALCHFELTALRYLPTILAAAALLRIYIG